METDYTAKLVFSNPTLRIYTHSFGFRLLLIKMKTIWVKLECGDQEIQATSLPSIKYFGRFKADNKQLY